MTCEPSSIVGLFIIFAIGMFAPLLMLRVRWYLKDNRDEIKSALKWHIRGAGYFIKRQARYLDFRYDLTRTYQCLAENLRAQTKIEFKPQQEGWLTELLRHADDQCRKDGLAQRLRSRPDPFLMYQGAK